MFDLTQLENVYIQFEFLFAKFILGILGYNLITGNF